MKVRQGAGEGLLIADELRRHAQRLHPDWPSEEDRREDLETHIRVSAALRSVQARKGPARSAGLPHLEAKIDRLANALGGLVVAARRPRMRPARRGDRGPAHCRLAGGESA